MKQLNVYNIYKLSLFFLFIHSMYPWFTWDVKTVYIYILVLPIIYGMYKKKYLSLNTPFTVKSSIFLFCLIFWMSKGQNLFGILESLFQWIIAVSIIGLHKEYKIDVFKFITKWFAILLLCSIIFYVLFLIGIPLPHEEINFQDRPLYQFFNYYFFITRSVRFQGPFLEPGHFTMGLAPLLFANRYNLKNRYVLILFIAQIISFSLAGYICLFVGYVFNIFLSEEKRKSLYSLLIAAIGIVGINYYISLVHGENIFESAIIERLHWEDGTISGDNRSSNYLDKQFDNIIHSENILWGQKLNQENLEKGVSGYKLFVVQNGLLGCILILMTYFTCYVKPFYGNKQYLFSFLLFMILILLQNAYPTWWCMLMSLYLGSEYIKQSKPNNPN